MCDVAAQLTISAHALARFRERQSLDADGRELLARMAAQAKRIGPRGDGELWRVRGSGRRHWWQRWRLVVVGDVVVTVLPPHDGWRP